MVITVHAAVRVIPITPATDIPAADCNVRMANIIPQARTAVVIPAVTRKPAHKR